MKRLLSISHASRSVAGLRRRAEQACQRRYHRVHTDGRIRNARFLIAFLPTARLSFLD